MVEGALPLLRHGLRRDGRGQGQPRRRDPRRHQGRGQSRPQLRQGLFPVEDHVRAGPADDAAPANAERQVRQARRVHAGHLGAGLRRHGARVQEGSARTWADGRRHVRVRPVDDLGGLRRQQADEGRIPLQQHRPERPPLHGVRGVRVHAHLRHGRADGLLRRHRSRRRLRALGLQHGRDAPDPVDARDRPAAERAAREGRRAVDLRASQLRPGRHADRVQAADRPGDPELHRPPHHRERQRQSRFRRQAHEFPARQHRHRLRASPGAPAGAARQERGRSRRIATDNVRGVREVRRPLHPEIRIGAVRRAGKPASGARRALRRPQGQGHVVLDHGIQPAHARRLVQPAGLQPPSSHRQDLRARQQPVLADRPAVGLRHGARGRHLRPPPARRHGRHEREAPRDGGIDLEAAGRHDRRNARLPRGRAEPDAEGRQAARLLGAGEQQHAGRRRT